MHMAQWPTGDNIRHAQYGMLIIKKVKPIC